MIVAVVVLGVVIVALLVDRHRMATEFAAERQRMLTAVLSRSGAEFASATRTPSPVVVPDRDPVEPMVGI